MSAPVSQMSAAVLSAGTEQLALVAAFGERANNARATRPGMPSILLERKGEVLSDEFRTRNPTLPRRPREEPIVLQVQGDGGRFLP